MDRTLTHTRTSASFCVRHAGSAASRRSRWRKKLGFSSVTLSALETGKNVSAVKVDRYLQQLGFRMVIVPKGADVKVTE